MRVPTPGTVAERHLMAVRQPGFLQMYRAAAVEAHNASVVRQDGNSSHTAVQSWGRFTLQGLGVPMLRPLDPLSSSLARKLSEVDLVEAWAYWNVAQVGVNTETAWQYVGVANAWHERVSGVRLAAGMPLTRVHNMLQGMQTLTGSPVLRRKRVGVRPKCLRAGIDRTLSPASNPADANMAALMEAAIVALARCGELAVGRGVQDLRRHPARSDVTFRWRHGVVGGFLLEATLHIVNSKAKGAERYRKLPVPLPARGKYLSPGLALWHLVSVVDPVPAGAAASTPLFRDPATGRALTVSAVRMALRSCMATLGLDGTAYGAHSLRIGGATALAFLRAGPATIQQMGRWRSDAYLSYLRDRRAEVIGYAVGIAGADVDDLATDYLGVDDFEFDAEDEA